MTTTNDYANIGASGDARAWAKQIADQAYNTSLSNRGDRDSALAEAKFAWQKVMDQAGLTGKFENEWTLPAMTGFANQFGTWAAPTPGQETMAREQQTFNQGQDYGAMYGQYYAPGTGPAQGQQTQAAQNQQFNQGISAGGLTGYYTDPQGNRVQTLAGQNQQFNQGMANQQEARAAQGQGQSQAMGYLNLLSGLRGPADWAKYQQVLGSTPGGMRDLVGAAMGQYVPGGGATTGMQPQAVSLQSMMGDVTGNPYSGQGGGQLQTPNVYYGGQGSYGQQQQGYGQPQQQGQQGGGQAMMTSQWDPNRQAYPQGQQQFQVMPGQGQLRTDVMPNSGQQDQRMYPQSGAPQQQAQQSQQMQWMGGQMGNQQGLSNYPQTAAPQQTWGSGIGVGQQQATPQQQQQGLGGGTNLPAPNQISAQGWKNMQPSQQQMLLGMYESQGWDKGDVQSLYNQSLPKYAANTPQAGTWKFQ